MTLENTTGWGCAFDPGYTDDNDGSSPGFATNHQATFPSLQMNMPAATRQRQLSTLPPKHFTSPMYSPSPVGSPVEDHTPASEDRIIFGVGGTPLISHPYQRDPHHKISWPNAIHGIIIKDDGFWIYIKAGRNIICLKRSEVVAKLVLEDRARIPRLVKREKRPEVPKNVLFSRKAMVSVIFETEEEWGRDYFEKWYAGWKERNRK